MGFNVRKSRTAGRASGRANFFDNFYLQFDRTSRQRCVYAMYRLDQFEHDAFNWRNFVIDLIKCPSNDLPAIEPPSHPSTHRNHPHRKHQQTEVEKKRKRKGSGCATARGEKFVCKELLWFPLPVVKQLISQ